MNPFYMELWWFAKVAGAIFVSGYWLSGQINKIVNAVKIIPLLKKTVDLHTRQIQANVLASKRFATVAFFPSEKISKKEHLDVIEEFDEILGMTSDEEEK